MRRPQNQAILAFLENEIGLEACAARTTRKRFAASRRHRARRPRRARVSESWRRAVAQENDPEAFKMWEQSCTCPLIARISHSTAWKRLAVRTGAPDRFTRMCRRLIEDSPQDWRARLALSRHLPAAGSVTKRSTLLFAALVQNPHALSIHQAIWRALSQLRHAPPLVDQYRELTRTRGLLSRSRTSACDAGTAALNSCGSAHTVTTGIPSSRNVSPPHRTRQRSRPRGRRARARGQDPERCCGSAARPPLRLRTTCSTCASVSSIVPSVLITKSLRVAFSSAGICAAIRCRASLSVRPRAISLSSCTAGGHTVAITRSKSPGLPVCTGAGYRRSRTRILRFARTPADLP